MPRNDMNPQHWTAFLRVLDTVPAGHHVSSNVLRDLLAAADIPEKSRGGLFSQAVNQGYLRPVANRYEPVRRRDREPRARENLPPHQAAAGGGRMTTTMNAGGGDWLDLPTRPVQHRGARKPEGLPWAELIEQYVARGGQVDAGVWHKGKVQVVEGGGRGKDRVHTYAVDSEYDETTASAAPMRVTRKRTATAARPREPRLSTEQRAEIATRYKKGDSITVLSKVYGVATGSITWALKKAGVKTRTPREAGRLRSEKRAS